DPLPRDRRRCPRTRQVRTRAGLFAARIRRRHFAHAPRDREGAVGTHRTLARRAGRAGRGGRRSGARTRPRARGSRAGLPEAVGRRRIRATPRRNRRSGSGRAPEGREQAAPALTRSARRTNVRGAPGFYAAERVVTYFRDVDPAFIDARAAGDEPAATLI